MNKDLNVLAVNSGSSSIKFALYRMGTAETEIWSGTLGGIGLGSGYFRVKDAGDEILIEKPIPLPEHGQALRELVQWLRGRPASERFDVAGHRLVHGGQRFTEPHLITPELMRHVEGLTPLAPDHLPHEIEAIRVFDSSYPDGRQVACFDTAFHRTLSEVARIYPLPGNFTKEGVLRYGFHGLSYEYLLGELRKEAGEKASQGRVIMAHLGNGASMAALRGGRSIETTMGFSPAGGLVMSTRTGDLDPGVLLYLLKEKNLDFPAVNRMVNKEGGLMGVSGLSPAMADLLRLAKTHPPAARAVELFCYQARKFLGSLAAVLGGLDTLIFTGGIGENAPSIRLRICENLEFLGIRLDARRNAAGEPILSAPGSQTVVRMMRTNEELMIARHASGVIREQEEGERNG